MRGSNVVGSNPQGQRSISKCSQIAPHLAHPSALARRDVFDGNESRPQLVDDSPHLVPETRARAAEACTSARAADVLAGEAAADEINGSKVCASDRFDIDVLPRVRPVLFEDLATERIDLDLPHDGPEPGPPEAKLEATNAREERAHRRHGAHPRDRFAGVKSGV
jgi:hypothetical protein